MDVEQRILEFEPNLEQEAPIRPSNKYKLYKVTFWLTKLPKGYCKRFNKKYNKPCIDSERNTLDCFFETEDTIGIHWYRREDDTFEKKGWSLIG